jgi:hypothetical protein
MFFKPHIELQALEVRLASRHSSSSIVGSA